ncbi:hypothetical protein [Rhodococcus sp. NPDC049939]|uniref:hypothetical protein n=1 Tax=Rhodococcus sp. NPDC049939 TaxID=3155511 RepID=UPI0034059DB5
MIKSVRAAATAALAAPLLALAFAAPANAAPEDVTLTAEIEGNYVKAAITNNSPVEILCEWATRPDEGPIVTSPGGRIYPGEVRSYTGWTVPDGSYTVSWWCRTVDASEFWGTGDFGFDVKTAEPIPFTAPVVPDDGGTDDGDNADDGSLGDLDPGILVGILEALTTGSAALGSS